MRIPSFLNRSTFIIVAQVVFIAGCFSGILGLARHNAALSPQQTPRTLAVHSEMARILQEEAPQDVAGVTFDRIASLQTCYLRSASGRSAHAFLGVTPHEAIIRAGFHRKQAEPGRWLSDSSDNLFWVQVYHPNEADAYDQDGMSESDFRMLVRQCVQAVRERVKAEQGPVETITERRKSWEPPQMTDSKS
jgi:hypothetical protein